MHLKIALIVSVILQFSAAIIALTLIRRTRTNIAWWLISAGFLLMAIRRVFELLQVFDSKSGLVTGYLSIWTGVIISVVMLFSLIFIKRIFNIQKRIDDLRKQNESRVLSAIIKTEENERQYFAKELHDGLGPLLSSVKMAISSRVRNGNENEYIKVMANAENLIEESIISLKEISNKLSPHILNNFGLYKAIKSFINKLQIIDKPKIHLNTNIDNQRFSYNIEVVMYRVICELISNTLDHAEANNIYINLIVNNKDFSLEYIDDGIGFDLESVEIRETGMGYSNIKSRIKSLNGSYQIATKPGEGVKVNINIYTK